MSEPRPRPVLATIPAYRPGLPSTNEEHKLSSNENPFPPLPGVIEAAAVELGRMNRYPDPGVTALGEVLAERAGLTPDHFAFGTGSVSVLFALLDAWCGPGDEVVYPWRSFEAYPIAVDLPGATSVRVPLTADHRHDLPAMAAAITDRTKVVLVCTPNNPTGTTVGAEEFHAFMAQVPGHVVVVVDEAYLEFVRDPEALAGADALARYSNVVVLRTFSKAYGLCGLRVGYSIAAPAITESIRKALPPFGVSDVAQAAALASIEAEAELAVRVASVVDERTRVVAALREQGWDVPDSHANFVWLPLGDRSAEFAEQVRPISVRPFPEGVRVSIGTPEINTTFLERAATFLRETPA
ncbi:histidinol-phosphate transaminase [Aeromicrobium senzhongii]|uniref:Aromatic amino acid aminotransferase n=1 Tax=Aeromicrobium senzhongii TaxID=2663859 RepID=A0ABX6ST30_9ACTN|nr:histidinol-phosphate transaminase [Aeromicrobium senzhongii]MTB89653.1 aminotransferase class I/II-fold pyridoxal phosphate-dependent enzyme [Aeromicrobium senzhongii]QNL94221.1 histidinol-phosphate transaminase [Aeromicrobium senzhongii]